MRIMRHRTHTKSNNNVCVRIFSINVYTVRNSDAKLHHFVVVALLNEYTSFMI